MFVDASAIVAMIAGEARWLRRVVAPIRVASIEGVGRAVPRSTLP